ncbi:potassium-transporting ATPase subunit KdpB [Geobacter sulfurreducens]|uniref:Potassium-transporting ATPase ATP-binding subunit n=1 Tax=Geobacter sulfurreducens (strain ATCC 51573 / DSM 12127 / PCA) TaxID=243231 RepID=Q74AA9_GEOSL|nr:potassium-transporting ATPase subunit KdpB [Geobacter sulfurreducens]AAR35854.1 potassium-transporting ATPase, B subunit [Geobacter sulfurreducens PCA]ADI85236.1 potassium-transporting ATPase, B subunit [Geobacter sulfurreducens KN400]AJY68719.1 potassium-transporting ATPase subunit B [Geobacter sulfurreducens]QVW34311.1 potassium-transporting ATPase subunit KdpB [Geobacter sulfurreducens]UAC03182.1 potassium-transporting ATPase subunit KdpB [Geobacter sulfurreducens]
MTKHAPQPISIFDPQIMRPALIESFRKLDPRTLWRNPVMFMVEIASIITLATFFMSLAGAGEEPAWFTGLVSLWLWLTVIFATFSEALAEGRGKARAASLRKTRTEVMAKRLNKPEFGSDFTVVGANQLCKDDYILVEAGELIAGDGDVFAGAALVNEAAVTGESAPVVRESGGDRSAVTGGTKVIANAIIVRITANPGETFLDRMISMIEGAKRRKTPNEIALEVLLIALTAVFLLVCANISPLSVYSVRAAGQGSPVSLTVLVALFVCLAPTTIAALLPAIGIAGMDRLFQKNVIALSGRAIEAAGDVNVLLLDKTGTITLGNREAVEFIPVGGHTDKEVAEAALMASLTDETPEGRSIVVLAKQKYGMKAEALAADAETVTFSAETRLSGLNAGGRQYRKGASDSTAAFVKSLGGKSIPGDLEAVVDKVARAGATPLVVSCDAEILGVVNLKDIIKGGIQERFQQLRSMGIKTVMITGDNPLTAAAIAAEAQVDDFLAQAKPEEKLRLIRENQAAGYMVAMTGDGTNDAPALAQADVAVAMNTGTQPAREAANIIDLDSNPTKLLDIVEVGKQILMTRGNLTTFSISNDIAKYFAIVPAMMLSVYPQLGALNIMGLATPMSAILSAVIFNAVIILLLVPLALKGTKFRPMPAEKLLINNLLIYGLGGVIAPFVGIKAIDMVVGLFV